MASIAKRPNGTFRARYRDEDGKEHAKHFKRKRDAQQWLNSVASSVLRGEYVDPKAGKITLQSWFDYWVKTKVWKRGTLLQAEFALKSTPFMSKEIRKVSHADIQGWVKSMTLPTKTKPAGLAPTTIKTRYKFVNMVFLAAVKERIIGRNPAEGVQLPRQRKAEASMQIPSPAELRNLMDNADPYFRTMIAVAAFAGLRSGEVAGLQVGDIDFLRRTISVQRQIQAQSNTTIEVTTPKDESERVVYVTDNLLSLIAEHLQKFGAWHASDGTSWLFANGRHQFWRAPISDRFAKVRKRSGVEGFTFHDLRHFYASGLILQGCDVVTVQRAIGHSSPSITLDTYSHLWPSAEDKTRIASAAVFEEVFEDSADSVRTEGQK